MITACAAKSRTFFDIGANLGYSSVCAGTANRQLKIVSVEMDRSLAPLIQANLDLNGIAEAHVVSRAVGDSNGSVSYTPHLYSFLAKAVGEETRIPEIKLETPIASIDELIVEFGLPDLVKMDVDGAETAALRAAEQMLEAPDLVLFLEVHPQILPEFGSSAAEVGAFLIAQGFSLYAIPDFRGDDLMNLRPLETLEGLSSPTCDMLLVTRRDVAGLME